jgi:hypothetical protein
MSARPLAIALVALACAVPASARAAGGWSAPATISEDGASRPRVVMGDDGAAVAAWSGGAGVRASVRPRGGSAGVSGGFGPPQALTPEPGFLLDLAGDRDGQLTATWITAGPAIDTAWGMGGGFGPRVRFPFGGVPLVAAAPGGDAFYAWLEDNGRLLAARRHEGTFGQPREVAAGGFGLAAVAVDAVGVLTLIGVAPDGTVLAATGTPESGFSAPRPISAPGGSAGSTSVVHATTGPRGDILVTWVTSATTMDAAIKPAGADWAAPEPVPATVHVQQQDLALDGDGNAIVVWVDDTRTWLDYRRADGRWLPTERLSARPVCCTPGPPPGRELHPQVAFDAHGTAVIAWGDLEPARAVRAAVRPPEGPVRPFETVATGAGASELELAVDPGRNAVAIWTATNAAGTTRIQAAAFDPSAPVITAFAPGRSARPTAIRNPIPPGFAYSVSEPASVRVDIDRLTPARARLGTLRSMGSSRSGRLTLSARLERRLAKLGRYRATITATTRGGRHPQPRYVDFRRVGKGR